MHIVLISNDVILDSFYFKLSHFLIANLKLSVLIGKTNPLLFVYTHLKKTIFNYNKLINEV